MFPFLLQSNLVLFTGSVGFCFFVFCCWVFCFLFFFEAGGYLLLSF